jgi:hypothetical protein
VIRSNDDTSARLLRGAVMFQVTNHIGIGVFASHLQTGGTTAFLANGNPFPLSKMTDTSFGATFSLRPFGAVTTGGTTDSGFVLDRFVTTR